MVELLKDAASILFAKANAGQLEIAGGFYDLDTGEAIL